MVRWSAIQGCPGYEISSDGQVRSLPRQFSRGVKCINVTFPGRVLSSFKAGRGYLQVNLGRTRREYVHRLVAEAFSGPTPHCDAEVNHIDGNKLNNNADNLEWCSRSENQQHKVRVLQVGVGDAHSNAKITNDQAREIMDSKESSKAISSRFGIAVGIVYKIRRRDRWRWLG